MPFSWDVNPEMNPRPPSTSFMIKAFWLGVIVIILLLIGVGVYFLIVV